MSQCDEKQPSCSQCLRLPGVSCPGAATGYVYLVANAENPQKYSRLETSHLGRRQPPQLQRDSTTKDEYSSGVSRRKRNPVASKEVYHNVRANTFMKKTPPPDRINAACLHERQIVANFIYFFAKPNTNKTKPTQWMVHLASMISDGSHIAHKASILSASLALHSTIHGDNMIYANEARKWYGVCINKMRARLNFLLPTSCDYNLSGESRPKICAQDVSMSLMLAYYEIFSTTSQRAYFEHILATGRFLEALGPEMCQWGHLNSLYRTIRVHMLYVSIVKGYSLLLESEAWKTIPFRFKPKTPLDNIVDVLTSFLAALSGPKIGPMFSILPYIVELHSINELLLRDKPTTIATTHSLPTERAYKMEQKSMEAKHDLYGYDLCRYYIPVESLLPSPPFALLDSEIMVTVAYYSLAWILILHQIYVGSDNINEKPSVHQPSTDISSGEDGIPDLTSIIQAHCSSVLTAGAYMDSCDDGCGYIRMMIALSFVAHLSPDEVQRESALYRVELWRCNKGFKGGLFGSSIV